MDELLEEISEEAQAERSGVFKPGAVWYTSWGYDQTNVEFFEVVAETRGTVTLRRLRSEVEPTGTTSTRVYPGISLDPDRFTTDWSLMGNSERWNPKTGQSEPNPVYVRDKARGYSEKVCRKPRRSKRGYYSLYLRIDDVRTAWPYDGGGRYETALGFGH